MFCLFHNNTMAFWCGVAIVCLNRMKLKQVEGERDTALEMRRTLSLEKEEQLESNGRLLKEARDRELDTAAELKRVEVCII